jgi:hypothetical protein
MAEFIASKAKAYLEQVHSKAATKIMGYKWFKNILDETKGRFSGTSDFEQIIDRVNKVSLHDTSLTKRELRETKKFINDPWFRDSLNKKGLLNKPYDPKASTLDGIKQRDVITTQAQLDHNKLIKESVQRDGREDFVDKSSSRLKDQYNTSRQRRLEASYRNHTHSEVDLIHKTRKRKSLLDLDWTNDDMQSYFLGDSFIT